MVGRIDGQVPAVAVREPSRAADPRPDALPFATDREVGRGGLVPVTNAVVAIAPTRDGKLLTVSRVVRDRSYTLVLARRFN